MPDLRSWLPIARRLVRLTLNLPDYETYRAHRRTYHPGEPILTRAEFVRKSQERRYSGAPGRAGCC